VRPVEARYEDGILKPEHPLARIAAAASNEDLDLAESGLDAFISATEFGPPTDSIALAFQVRADA